MIEGDAVVTAMGPWSILASRWLSLPGVYGLKGHSIVFKTGSDVPPEALSLEFPDHAGETLSQEFSPVQTVPLMSARFRAMLLCQSIRLRSLKSGAIERLEALSSRLSPALTSSRIIARQACYRPVTQDGLPLIGEVPGAPGAYVATGHSVWGILNAPATAEALSELICDRHTQAVELNPFSPGRRSLAPSRLF